MNVTLHPEFLKLSKTQRYLLGISGGRDSVALLHLLLDTGYRELVLCHVNHGLRGEESDQDADFVQRLAEKHDLPCEVEQVDVAQRMQENGESMELAARNVRHRFFRDCAKKHHCQRILLAHHADDQAETVLFNLLRGSNGLKGMSYHSSHEVEGRELEIFRPLLHVTRSEIDTFLTDHDIEYRDDTSNAEAIATRNRLRNEAIPLLNEIMGRDIRPALLRAEQLSQSQHSATQKLLDDVELLDPQGRIFLPMLAKLSPALQSTVIHGYLKEHHVANVSHNLLESCLLLISDPSIAKINLPRGRFLRRKEKRIFIQ